MSQIRTPSLALGLLLLLFVFVLFGCGDKNSQATLEPSVGKHPADWLPIGHKAAALANILSCTACHGEDYSGGISKISCFNQPPVSGFACHATSPAAKQTGCISCHGGIPNGPNSVFPNRTGSGNIFPNRSGSHPMHTALLTGCATCHRNAGTGTTNHARGNGVTVSFDTFVNTASPAAYNAANGTCSSVSCHGGINTPSWSVSPKINLLAANDNSLCLKCHAQGTASGVPQYNSFYSGVSTVNNIPNLHVFHLVTVPNVFPALFPQGVNCTDCHNISKLTDYQLHFGGITTKTLILPERTIGNDNPNNTPTTGTTRFRTPITGPSLIGFYVTGTKTCTNVACHARLNNFPGKWIN